MSDEKIIAIARKLLEKSSKGEVTWSITADEEIFSVAFPEYSISVRQSPNAYYELSVHDERGNVVESFQPSPNHETFLMLAELFNSARRTALKTDEMLDNILERLSGD